MELLPSQYTLVTLSFAKTKVLDFSLRDQSLIWMSETWF